jgi:hypothetical protein
LRSRRSDAVNTERPDNDEASGGGDGSSAKARGAGALGAEETRGSDAHGDETSPSVAPAEEESHAGAEQDGGAEGAEEATGTTSAAATDTDTDTDTDKEQP